MDGSENEMTFNDEDIERVYDHCVDLTGIRFVYEEIVSRFPRLSSAQHREAFLECLAELLRRGWLEFLGEEQLFYLGEVPRVGGMLRPDLAPYRDLREIIESGGYWRANPEQRRRLRDGLMFDDEVFPEEEGGVRLPRPNTPDAVIQVIRDKWPRELVPESRKGDGGFDPLWFEKWCFEWVDRDQRP
jgi:hypothetical protein